MLDARTRGPLGQGGHVAKLIMGATAKAEQGSSTHG